MPPFIYDQPTRNSLTQMIMQVTMIGIVAGSFFQPAESLITTVVTLLLVGLAFDGTHSVIRCLKTLTVSRLRTYKTFEEGTVEYHWIKSFLIEKNKWPSVSGTCYDPTDHAIHMSDFWWNSTWIKVARIEQKGGYFGNQNEVPKPYIELKLYSFKSSAVSDLLKAAKRQYGESRNHNVTVYSPALYTSGIPSNQQNWSNKKEIPARLMDATSLSIQALASLVDESRDFFDSEAWHNEIGIPWHRKYLLYGPTGSGKRDAVFALAGKLGRSVYNISLHDTGMVDNSFLLSALATVPKGSIFLVENIQGAFGWPPAFRAHNQGYPIVYPATTSGLFAMLETAAHQEGVLLFLTSTKLDRLDDELVVPGRVDKKVEFGYITKEQISGLFFRFFTGHSFTNSGNYSVDKWSLQLGDLADEFCACVPENEFTISQLRSYLLTHQSSPASAVADVKEWVKEKLEEKASLRVEQAMSRKFYPAPIMPTNTGSSWTSLPVPAPPIGNFGPPLVVDMPPSVVGRACSWSRPPSPTITTSATVELKPDVPKVAAESTDELSGRM